MGVLLCPMAGAEPSFRSLSYDISLTPDFATGFWSPWSHVERRDDRLLLFADELPPGIHERSFVARATTPGRFLSRPAQAEEMYSPEVFGRSDGGIFEVLDPEAPGAR